MPKEIGNLKKLKDFTLWLNNLTKFPKEIVNLVRLERLEINRGDNLKEFPKEIINLVKLKDLEISHCNKIKNLPKEIETLTKLKRFRIASLNLKVIPKEIKKI